MLGKGAGEVAVIAFTVNVPVYIERLGSSLISSIVGRSGDAEVIFQNVKCITKIGILADEAVFFH